MVSIRCRAKGAAEKLRSLPGLLLVLGLALNLDLSG